MSEHAAPLALDPAARWVVAVTMATAHAVTESALVHMDDRAQEDHEATVAARADGPGLVLTAEVSGAQVAAVASWAAQIAEDVAGYGVVSAMWLVDLHVRTPEQYEADAAKPTVPALAGAADVAELLKVSRQRVHQLLTERSDFPAPVAHVKAGPLWVVSAIEAFDRGWERRVGRPPKTTTSAT